MLAKKPAVKRQSVHAVWIYHAYQMTLDHIFLNMSENQTNPFTRSSLWAAALRACLSTVGRNVPARHQRALSPQFQMHRIKASVELIAASLFGEGGVWKDGVGGPVCFPTVLRAQVLNYNNKIGN